MAIYEQFFRSLRYRPAVVSDVVPWRHLAAPGVLLLKERHALMRTFVVQGQDPLGTTPEQQGAVMLQVNNVLKRLGGRWVLHAEAQRTRLTEYPACLPDAPAVARHIDQARRRQLLETPGARETRYYLTLTWMPPTPTTQAARRFFVAGTPPVQSVQTEEQVLRQFVTETQYFMGLLRGVLASCRPATTRELLTYLHTAVSDRWYALQLLASPLDIDTQLCDTPYVGGWYPQLGRWHLRTCSITAYPAQSTVGILRDLEAKALDFRWVVRWMGMEKHFQSGLLQRTQKKWINHEKGFWTRSEESISGKEARVINSDATRKAEQVDAARQELGADIVAYGTFTTTVTVWDTDPAIADEKLQEVMQTFASHGFTTVHERQQAEGAWRSSMPGNRLDNVRKTPQHSLTLAHLCPGLSAAWTGELQDTHFQAPPWFLAHTEESSAFRVVNHVQDNGHSLILGATGSGKSVFCAFMVAQWMARYRQAQCFWFDVDKSARITTLLLGGHWYDLGGGDVHFQPLRDIHTVQEAAWAVSWLAALCREVHVPVTAEVSAYLGAGVRELAKRSQRERTLSGLIEVMAMHSLQVERTAKAGRIDAQGISHPDRRLEDLVAQHRLVRTALKPYTMEGTYGWLLDAASDDLQEGPLHTFEQRALLEMPDLVGPVTRYLFHRIEQRFSTDTPTWLPVDEAALLFALPDFEKKGKEWLMTTRKKNVSLGFFTHSISQVFESRLGPLLMEGCPSRYYLPNSAAKAPQMAAVYRQLGLTDGEITTIATAMPQRDVYFSAELLGKRLFHLKLEEDVLQCVARNTAADHDRMDRLLERYGREGFAAAWLRGEEGEEDTRAGNDWVRVLGRNGTSVLSARD